MKNCYKEALMSMSRRDFFKNAATQAAAIGFISAGGLELRANPLGMPIGCQTWPVRDMVAKDSGTELRRILGDAGVTCVSSHFSITELREHQESRIAWAKDVGLTQMIVPTLGGPGKPTMDDVKRAADEYNKMGARSARTGIQQGLHNEDFELTMVEGKRTYDLLLDLLDPKLVKFQFQVSTISRGYDAAEYFTKYPGRFMSMHVQGWLADAKKIMPVGQDTLDWKKIFAAAKTGGLKNYFVEMNLEMMKASVPYLRELPA